jgi:hypothetical protein
MNPDGSWLQRITRSRAPEYGVVWSPYGLRLAFLRGNGDALYVMNADRSGLRKLADGGS